MGGGTPQRWSARIVAVFALAAGALALGTGASHACSCIRPSVVDEARSADAVFVGTVSNGAATGVSNSVEMTVTGVYKGRARGGCRDNGSCCAAAQTTPALTAAGLSEARRTLGA